MIPRPRSIPARARLGRRLALALLLAATVPPATAATEEAPRFYLETLLVEGAVRPSAAEIVRAEARLAPEREYSEAELRDAVHRVRRLPFVVAADLALRRGSERGRYALVITVEEASAGFFAADVALLHVERPLSEALGYSKYGDYDASDSGTAGFQLFLGPRGVFFGAAHDQELQAGYTRYGLFGGNGSASLALSYSPDACCSEGEILPLGLDPAFSSWSLGERRRASLTVDVPLHGNHALRLAATELRANTSLRREVLRTDLGGFASFPDEELTRREVELKWIHDTRDDPLFPSHGSALSAGVELAESSVPVRAPETPPDLFPVPPADDRSESRIVSLAAAATRSWPLSARQAVTLGGRAAAGRARVGRLALGNGIVGPRDLDTLEASAEVKHSLSLWSAEHARRSGDLRLETSALYGYEGASPNLGFTGNPVRRLVAGTALVFRNVWGIFRLGLTYLSLEGVEP